MNLTRKNLISKVLTDNKKAMHLNDIADEMIKRGYEQSEDHEKLVHSISAILARDVRKKRSSVFSKIKNKKGGFKKGYYKAKPQKSTKKKTISDIEKSTKTNIESIPAMYTGKGGEYAVLSELLFNKFNASLMSVDQGIDIVASKDDQFFYVQVKTANNRKGNFFASINKNQFKKYNIKKTFYIFVIRYSVNNESNSSFIVFASTDIERFKDTNIIKDGANLNLTFNIHEGKIWLNNSEDVTYFLNKFNYIK